MKNSAKNCPWTTEEEQMIRSLYTTLSASAFAAKLPGRSVEAIGMKARAMGIYRRTPMEKKPVAPRAEKSATEKFHLTKLSEPANGLAAQLRALPFTDPLRLAYLRATPPGSKAGSAPRTMAQLREMAANPSLRGV